LHNLPERNLYFVFFWGIVSNLVGRSALSACCPGKKAGAEDKKGREKPSQVSPLCFRKETRGQRDTRAETAEVRLGKRGITAFFGPAKGGTFLPGQGIIQPLGSFSIRRTQRTFILIF
jgi:hypothetical protein